MSFSLEKITSLKDLPKDASIHIIGVCGVAMAQIAILLSEQGYKVSGSDKEFYDPMKSLLSRSKIVCHLGYDAKNLSADLDLVVIGNSVTRDNVEVKAAEQLSLAYSLFPQMLYEVVIAGKHSIVVSGTHGKSTTSAMIAWTLEQLALQPGYFVGGRVRQLSESLHAGDGKFSVVEGDEYDSAFFAKLPKFHFYKPDTLIITSLEFDHADIYSNLDAIRVEFEKLVSNMPPSGTVVLCNDDENLRTFATQWKDSYPTLVTYGESADSNVVVSFRNAETSGLIATATRKNGSQFDLSLSLTGRYNQKNAIAAVLALEAAGLPLNKALFNTLAEFKGVDRRQQVWLEQPITLIEDFAHHPTAVKETLLGLREWYPQLRIIAVFEPRSNTSRKKIFQADYVKAFSQQADVVVMKEVESRGGDTAGDMFDVKEVCAEISASGVSAKSFLEISEIEAYVTGEAKPGDVVVVMSNGSFGGLIERLSQRLVRVVSAVPAKNL